MQYPHIIAQIDAYLERLVAARLLLTTLTLSPAAPHETALSSVPSRKRNAVAKTKSPETVSQLAVHIASTTTSPNRKTKSAVSEKPEKATQAARSLKKSREQMALELVLVSDNSPVQVQPQKQTTQAVEEVVVQPIVTASTYSKLPPARKRRASNKQPAVRGATALGGSVPTGPIFIPAKQIRQEQSLRQQESAITTHLSSSSAVPITAELLAQRWLQN